MIEPCFRAERRGPRCRRKRSCPVKHIDFKPELSHYPFRVFAPWQVSNRSDDLPSIYSASVLICVVAECPVIRDSFVLQDTQRTSLIPPRSAMNIQARLWNFDERTCILKVRVIRFRHPDLRAPGCPRHHALVCPVELSRNPGRKLVLEEAPKLPSSLSERVCRDIGFPSPPTHCLLIEFQIVGSLSYVQ